MRAGNWKMLRNGNRLELFDLASDPGEKQDVADAHSEVLGTMDSQWKAWAQRLAEPLWREPRGREVIKSGSEEEH